MPRKKGGGAGASGASTSTSAAAKKSMQDMLARIEQLEQENEKFKQENQRLLRLANQDMPPGVFVVPKGAVPSTPSGPKRDGPRGIPARADTRGFHEQIRALQQKLREAEASLRQALGQIDVLEQEKKLLRDTAKVRPPGLPEPASAPSLVPSQVFAASLRTKKESHASRTSAVTTMGGSGYGVGSAGGGARGGMLIAAAAPAPAPIPTPLEVNQRRAMAIKNKGDGSFAEREAAREAAAAAARADARDEMAGKPKIGKTARKKGDDPDAWMRGAGGRKGR